MFVYVGNTPAGHAIVANINGNEHGTARQRRRLSKPRTAATRLAVRALWEGGNLLPLFGRSFGTRLERLLDRWHEAVPIDRFRDEILDKPSGGLVLEICGSLENLVAVLRLANVDLLVSTCHDMSIRPCYTVRCST